MLGIIAPLLVFGIVIFIHELGHFMAAKWLGVYAPRFSIGFGPTLWKRRRGETEYVLAAFPLGGYVRMASKHDEEAAILEGGSEEKSARAADDPEYDPEAMLPFGPKPIPADRWFESKPLWARLIILLAGVFMNVVLTFVVMTGLAMHYGRAVVPTTVVGDVTSPAFAPALDSQLVAGDTIRTVNGVAVRTWNDIYDGIEAGGAGDSIVFTTNRGTVVVPVEGAAAAEQVSTAVRPYQPPVIAEALAGRPAARAGLQAGDTVVSIDGEPVRSWPGMVERVGASAGSEIVMTVRRAGGQREIRVTPEPTDEADPATGKISKVGRIGAAPVDISYRQPIGFGEAVQGGWRGTWRMGGAIIGFVQGLFAGDISVKQLGGPIAITQASVEAGQAGIVRLVELIALLSINVAILNLLPIPILDGGQVLLNIAESAKGSPFSLRTREYILRVGLAAIALLFALVMFNDLGSLFRRFF